MKTDNNRQVQLDSDAPSIQPQQANEIEKPTSFGRKVKVALLSSWPFLLAGAVCAVAAPFVAIPILVGVAAGTMVGSVITSIALYRKNIAERSVAVVEAKSNLQHDAVKTSDVQLVESALEHTLCDMPTLELIKQQFQDNPFYAVIEQNLSKDAFLKLGENTDKEIGMHCVYKDHARSGYRVAIQSEDDFTLLGSKQCHEMASTIEHDSQVHNNDNDDDSGVESGYESADEVLESSVGPIVPLSEKAYMSQIESSIDELLQLNGITTEVPYKDSVKALLMHNMSQAGFASHSFIMQGALGEITEQLRDKTSEVYYAVQDQELVQTHVTMAWKDNAISFESELIQGIGFRSLEENELLDAMPKPLYSIKMQHKIAPTQDGGVKGVELASASVQQVSEQYFMENKHLLEE